MSNTSSIDGPRRVERNAYTPRLAAHYRPAPVQVWIFAVLLLGIIAGGAAMLVLLAR